MPSSSSSIRVDIYLPLFYNNNKRIEKLKFVDTFNELVGMFDGCSADQYSILGSWKDPHSDALYNDENRIYHIICEDTEENRTILRKYKEKLKERFRQKEIMMYYINVNRF
ncbi:MAG TPA: hypothetical protein VJ697_10465 [Nitrososphaeraceae archaeon]|nr:hypothetical protein [Nitrososphaeraceae archaeon]